MVYIYIYIYIYIYMLQKNYKTFKTHFYVVKNFQNSLKNNNNTLYTSKQPLMMAYEGSESSRDNFGLFIYQLQLETKTLIRKLERILNKLYRQNLSLLFNEICLNELLHI